MHENSKNSSLLDLGRGGHVQRPEPRALRGERQRRRGGAVGGEARLCAGVGVTEMMQMMVMMDLHVVYTSIDTE